MSPNIRKAHAASRPGGSLLQPHPSASAKASGQKPRRGAPESPSRGSSGGFPPPEPQPQRGSQGAGRLVSAGDPLGRGRRPCHLAPFKAQKAIHVLFMGPLGSSCSPEVRGPSSQRKIKTFSPGLCTFWKLWKALRARRVDAVGREWARQSRGSSG